MLIGNGMLIDKVPLTRLGQHWNCFVRDERIPASHDGTEGMGKLSAVPSGTYAPAAILMPRMAGGMQSMYLTEITLTPTASGTMGMPAEGSADIAIAFSDAAGELISSGNGTAAVTVSTNTPLLTASMSGTGSGTISISTNTPILGAEASLTGEAVITLGGLLTPYAIGIMAGSTEDSGTLTPAAIAAAVMGAAASSPIYADIRQVNGTTVSGTGHTGDEWGPA